MQAGLSPCICVHLHPWPRASLVSSAAFEAGEEAAEQLPALQHWALVLQAASAKPQIAWHQVMQLS